MVEFRILGPLEVVEDGESVALGTLKERLVLGVLLLHANEFVSPERIIDELWGVAPPPTARKAVQVYVSKLRKVLGGNGRDPIATADGGYRLKVNPDRFDADRMRSLVADARGRMTQGDSEKASQLLRDALAIWRWDVTSRCSASCSCSFASIHSGNGCAPSRCSRSIAPTVRRTRSTPTS